MPSAGRFPRLCTALSQGYDLDLVHVLEGLQCVGRSLEIEDPQVDGLVDPDEDVADVSRGAELYVHLDHLLVRQHGVGGGVIVEHEIVDRAAGRRPVHVHLPARYRAVREQVPGRLDGVVGDAGVVELHAGVLDDLVAERGVVLEEAGVALARVDGPGGAGRGAVARASQALRDTRDRVDGVGVGRDRARDAAITVVAPVPAVADAVADAGAPEAGGVGGAGGTLPVRQLDQPGVTDALAQGRAADRREGVCRAGDAAQVAGLVAVVVLWAQLAGTVEEPVGRQAVALLQALGPGG
eukprot:765506-Hanusia_phi.AAC.8